MKLVLIELHKVQAFQQMQISWIEFLCSQGNSFLEAYQHWCVRQGGLSFNLQNGIHIFNLYYLENCEISDSLLILLMKVLEGNQD